MNITNLNRIFTTRGAAAALDTARAAMMDGWIIRKLEAGEWNVDHKPAPKPVEIRTVVDRVGDNRLVKVTLGRDVLGYQLEVMGESGKVVSIEGLGKLSLAEARALIGKSISHPVPHNAGKPTNDPTNMCPKGASGGGGGKGGQSGGNKKKGK